jgi:hypothetical protein
MENKIEENKIEEFLRVYMSGTADGSISIYVLPENLIVNDEDGMPSAETHNMFERALYRVLEDKGGHITGIQERDPPSYMYAFGEGKDI